MSRIRLAPLALLVASALTLGLSAGPWARAEEAAEQAESDGPALSVEALVVEPVTPAADTLCRLRVTLRNGGGRTVSHLGFSVTINGVELPVYVNQLFMYAVEPGTTLEIPLYNFWSTETSRPAPENGKLRIVVALREAQWVKIETEDEIEVWTPLGAVEDLPVKGEITLTMTSS